LITLNPALTNKKTFYRNDAFRWLLSHMVRYPIHLVLFLLTAVGSIVLHSLSFIYLGNLFEWLQGHSPSPGFIGTAAMFAGALVGGGVMQWVSTLILLRLRLKVEKDIREEVYNDLLVKSQSFHDSARSGELMALGTNELRNISVMFQPGLNMSLRSVLFYIVPLIFIMQGFDRVLWFGPLIFSFVSFWLLWRYSQQVTTVNIQMRQQFGKLNADLHESLDGIETVKANVREVNEQKRFVSNLEIYKQLARRRALLEAGYLPTLIFYLFLSSVLFQSLFLYKSGAITLGEVIAYLGLFMSMQYPIQNAEITFSFLSAGVASARNILKKLCAPAALRSPDYPIDRDMIGAIEFRNVTFGYVPDRPVLHDISFRAQPGETIAIVGTTGSGKSSLVKLVNRMYDPDGGQILIDGIDVTQWDVDRLRSQIGIVEQDTFLFSWSVKDNVKFGGGNSHAVTDAEIERACGQCQADAFIRELDQGYDTPVGERGVQLSGGQRQRVAMGRAFVSQPKILVLDDATSAVDSETEQLIQSGMQQMMEGRTTFLITHRLPQIQRADRILVLVKGRLAAMGKHEQLMISCPEYRELFEERKAI
jgi:ATP-binding cassette subfamily B protein